MSLSVTEKTELKQLINNRINRRKGQIMADHRSEIDAQRKMLETETLSQLGMTGVMEQADRLANESKTLLTQRLDMLVGHARRLGVSEHSVEHYLGEHIKKEIEKATARWVRGQPFGAELRALEEEQERLLETVWIATSPKQVKQLLDALNTLLGTTRTPLEDSAQRLDAME